jgi:hypothetical protein
MRELELKLTLGGGSLHRWLLLRTTLKNNGTTEFQDSGLLFKLKLLVEHRIQEGEHRRLLNEIQIE